jgi:hypothetical protein
MGEEPRLAHAVQMGRRSTRKRDADAICRKKRRLVWESFARVSFRRCLNISLHSSCGIRSCELIGGAEEKTRLGKKKKADVVMVCWFVLVIL